MAIQTVLQINNPITGVFGFGNVQVFGIGMSGTFTVPAGVSAVRVRLWGAGGGVLGSGGGFALKTIYGLTPGSGIAITVGAGTTGNGATSSFGSYVSATGGLTTAGQVGGYGVGGDINTTGGASNTSGSGGSASLFGNGGNFNTSAAAGGGYGSINLGQHGGSGFTGNGGWTATSYTSAFAPSAGNTSSIDYIGTGGGGGAGQTGINGGGGGSGSSGGFPGGGGGSSTGVGAGGLVIVEW